MRKKRGQYKVCGRLGYNAMLRLWSGKKKKWEKQGRFYEGSRSQESVGGQKKGVVNPIIGLSNEERRGERGLKESTGKKQGPSMIRRKDVHGRVQSQKTGRKRRYGGVKRKTIRKNLEEQREIYKSAKSESEQRYRKGRRQSEGIKLENRGRDRIVDEKVTRKTQKKQNHRFAKTESRVDMRRWRSGRVPTLQMGRDLIEHGHVIYMDKDGVRGKPVKWQGAVIEVGNGRKIDEVVWKNIKGRSRNLVGHEEYAKAGARYMEVDYVTGRRVVLRKAGSNEVMMPKGMELSGWTSF